MGRQDAKDDRRAESRRPRAEPTRPDREQAQEPSRIQGQQPRQLAPEQRPEVWGRAATGEERNQRQTKSQSGRGQTETQTQGGRGQTETQTQGGRGQAETQTQGGRGQAETKTQNSEKEETRFETHNRRTRKSNQTCRQKLRCREAGKGRAQSRAGSEERLPFDGQVIL